MPINAETTADLVIDRSATDGTNIVSGPTGAPQPASGTFAAVHVVGSGALDAACGLIEYRLVTLFPAVPNLGLTTIEIVLVPPDAIVPLNEQVIVPTPLPDAGEHDQPVPEALIRSRAEGIASFTVAALTGDPPAFVTVIV